MEIHLLLGLCLGFLSQHQLVLGDNFTAYCSDGEAYQMCGACERTCESPFSTEACTTPCSPGCFCRAGLVRNRLKRCVEPKLCNASTTCEENEEYLECGSSCPLTCSNYQDSIFCTKQCTKGCFCKPGYVQGPNRKCILPQNCPIGPCHGNEVPTDCVNPCNNCAQRGKCTFEYCSRGCDCKPGFHKNSTGQCVEAKDCDVAESACPKNERFVQCVNLCNDCWSRGDCEQMFCQPGCDCVPGFFRDDNGDCVTESQCSGDDVSCGVNEEYTDCINPCNDCVKKGQCEYNCEYGCDCKKGFFRDSKGVCVPEKQCEEPKDSPIEGRSCRSCKDKCPVNQQYYVCKPTCKTTCDNFNDSTVPCGADCRAGCACKQGLVKRRDGACILPSECPQTCGVNEEYSVCGPSCPESCDNLGKSIMCTHYCVKGCFCKKGFVKGPGGVCIQPQLCPAECGENEEFQHCGTQCPLTCSNQVRKRSCGNECVRGCFCKAGLIRAPDGRCINPAFCPVDCGVNEEFRKCGTACPVTCANYTSLQTVPCPRRCVPGCFCKPGLIRGPDGACIKPSFCPSICGTNQQHLSCGPCPLSCTNFTQPSPRNFQCYSGCFCLPGFVLGPDGSCINPTSCPPTCGKNEMFQDCGTACPATCDNPVPQRCPQRCVRDCFCLPGFLRAPSGKCVRPEDCPKRCGLNQQHLDCGPCPLSCNNFTAVVPRNFQCYSGCFCNSGFVLGPDGSCIPIDSCRPDCGLNQEFLDCGPCPLTCSNFTAIVPRNFQCYSGCFCKPGFVIGPDGSCIPIASCHPECGPNEEHLDCGPCPLTCSNFTAIVPRNFQCYSGCFCKPGFVIGLDGSCVPIASCLQKCGHNEVFRECGLGCPVTCENHLRPQPCLKRCERGCFCAPGFVRGPLGTCVRTETCRPGCGLNQEFLDCGPCPLTCNNFTALVPRNFECYPGCFCKSGFVLGPDGSCIPIDSCRLDVGCRENEEFKLCGSPCAPTCTNLTSRQFCPNNCIRGCFCKEGFVKDPSGRCVLPQLCPGVCKENEDFMQCGPACPETCDSYQRPLAPCPLPCTSGCFCKTGFVKGPDGRCIESKFCPVVCGENEQFQECGTSCPLTCLNRTRPGLCPRNCVRGCFCKPGFVRDMKGKCILPETCPVVCPAGQNLEFRECGPGCPITCDTLTLANVPCSRPCTKGCFCKPGFVRNPQGRCVLPAFCPIVCGEQEEFKDCGPPCPMACSNITVTERRLCPSSCIKGCFCKEGFVRDPTGKCISPQACPVVCKTNEEFKECGPSCQVSCEKLGVASGPCPLTCHRGCFCKPGFVRDKDGNCVLPSLCPVVCGVNEEFRECGSSCAANCSSRFQSIACPAVCTRGCFCKDGFFRDDSGKCVPPDLCPVVCKENEMFRECGPSCQLSCDNLSKNLGSCMLQCVKGCFCKPGYVRNKEGNCILPSLCPVVCGENEEFQDCGTACPATCSHPNRTEGCQKICIKGCFCKTGFVRNSEGLCVQPRFCPVICRENEVFEECGSACPRTCNDIGKPIAPCKLPCRRGCCCKPGYVQNKEGRCILPNFCPVMCGDNEQFLECGSACPANCTNRFEKRSCSISCVKGCFCREGFVRNSEGKCVRPDVCPVVCKENEQYLECGSSCSLTCDNIGTPNLPCSLQCVKGCFCKPGYVKDKSGRCILPHFCPVVCGINEEFQDCGTACPTNCLNRLQSRQNCPNMCVKGCFCKSGFIRNTAGKCVLPAQCPVVCRPNEEFKECGLPCQITCDNLGIPVASCPLPCTRGCYCKPGFVRNRDGNCVRPSSCPIICGENEEFNNCGSACPATCTNRVEQRNCPSLCVKGCVCKPGFLRDPMGKCVKPDYCPVVCRENEEFKECGSACPATCDRPSEHAICPAICVRGCFCKPGFVKDPTGKCVLPNRCPMECGQDEFFDECGPGCPASCSSPKSLTPCPLNCVRGCFCKPGFIRDPMGKCVPPEKCPIICEENEEFKECGQACSPTCTDITPRNCASVCIKGCFCKQGYVRDPIGQCVLPAACPKICDVNEEFKSCGTACPATCKNFTNPAPCQVTSCINGCFCKAGFIRGPNGKCIDPNACPDDCSKPYEEFRQCGPKCIATCTDLETRQGCINGPCVTGCFCKKGFVRDMDGNCVRPSDCPKEPQKCPPGETFYVCVPPCGNTCDTQYPEIQQSCRKVCRSGCFCHVGYVKRHDGKCVLPRRCPGSIEFRRLSDSDDDTTTSGSTLKPTTTGISTKSTKLTTNSTTSAAQKTAITTTKLPTSHAASTVQSTTPTTSAKTTSLPSASIGIAEPRVSLRFIPSTPASITKKVAISTPGGTQTASPSTPKPVTTKPITTKPA